MTARVSFARTTRLHTGPSGGLVVGGSPRRVLRLNAAAARVLVRWREDGSVRGPAETALARRLHATGLLTMRRATSLDAGDVTVVVPVRDAGAALGRCLASIGPCARVVVVDDASADAAAVAATARPAGAEVVRRSRNGGPAAARNTGLGVVRTPLVAFVDADCVLPRGWLDALLASFLDQAVAVVAPRVVGAGGSSWLARYETSHGPLDMGDAPAPVRRGGAVPYVPSAVLVCRRAALAGGFDERLRAGEDVDLVWRLAAAGHEVRYDPAVVVAHETRPTVRGWLRQRHAYGTAAAPLDRRHPGAVAPAVVSPWFLPAVGGVLARRPRMAAGAVLVAAAGTYRRLPAGPGRHREAGRLSAGALGATLVALADAGARVWLPPLLVLSCRSRRVRTLTAAAYGVRAARSLTRAWPAVPVPAWAFLRVADDLAYAAGVWHGALLHRRPRVLLPRVSSRAAPQP